VSPEMLSNLRFGRGSESNPWSALRIASKALAGCPKLAGQ